ncbi:FAD-binding oxidoreductase [Planotetraspora kaengkrachanensis]|uniref:6-hydroxy-D-nicotine oxidase n=1 Tax=Planotetraspora kaengkrachanensis TaxID=575193 RepID=A0A8J3VBG5_9ACTN|nr:FAD-binding oxidoreductase [Planotetraspora kaengkrachanensis]GIG83966.1 6-hydroxy-D-nicotine oxidase [Planotetraspora kaengkrachanensis]
MGTHDRTRAAARDLETRLGPGRVSTSGPAYDQTIRIWNGAVTHRPAVIVHCATPSDVQAAVDAARTHGLPLSVRAGGHDWAGRSLRHDGLVVDLAAMTSVAVDPDASVATVSGGATVAHVIAAAAPHGLFAVTGTVGHVGMAGLTLGGGYGPLGGRFGLALDNLLAAEVVLADGRLVIADETRESELFWALRGGGGNFGVVTSMRLRLHEIPGLLAGLIVYPWSQAGSVLRGFADLIASAPDELTVQTGVLSGPDGSPTLFLSPAWSGPPSEGAKHIDELTRLGTPLLSQVAPMSYAEMLGLFDAHIAVGRHYSIRTRSLPAYTPEAIDAMVFAGDARTSPLSGIAVHHFHGAAAAVPPGDTAFGERRDHFAAEIVAAWEPDGDGGAHRAWAGAVSSALEPCALPGGYPNLLGPDDRDQAEVAYGGNAGRLRAAKRRYDPDAVFSAIPLPHTD